MGTDLLTHLQNTDGPGPSGGQVRMDGPEIQRISAAVGLSVKSLQLVAMGFRRCSWPALLRIQEATNCAVDPCVMRPDLCPQPAGPPPEPLPTRGETRAPETTVFR